MQAEMSAGPRDCSAEFRKRRNRLILIAFPLAAAMMLVYEAFNDPDLQLYGMTHAQTLWLGIGATAFLFGLNLYDWRCPNCNVYLNNGVSIPFCKGCGALFVPPKADEATMRHAEADPRVAAEVRRAQAHTALQSEINQHRNNSILGMMKGFVVVGLGALMAFVLDEPASQEGWLYQKFGPAGAAYGPKVFGWAVMVLGVAWIAWEARSMAKVKQQLTEKYRDLLGLES